MRNAAQAQDLAKWDEWVSTPITSPKSALTQSMASMLHGKIARAEANGSISMREREGSFSARTNGRDDAQSPNGSIGKGEGKPVRTRTSSSAPDPAHGGEDFQQKERPTTISTDIVEAAPEDAPPKPTWFVACDGCDEQWTVMDQPLLNCADCVGNVQLDYKCHALLMKDELRIPGFKCRKEHKFLEIPNWDDARFKDMPRHCLPLSADANHQKRWIPLDEWKMNLRNQYLVD